MPKWNHTIATRSLRKSSGYPSTCCPLVTSFIAFSLNMTERAWFAADRNGRSDLFQEHLPLIRFNDSDLTVPVTISSGTELSDGDDDDTGPSAYAQGWHLSNARCLRIQRLQKITIKYHGSLCGFFIGQLVVSVRIAQECTRHLSFDQKSPRTY
ncbi:hypothetical protein V1505DRAFT_376688 [Lipomyces doorenjongii]